MDCKKLSGKPWSPAEEHHPNAETQKRALLARGGRKLREDRESLERASAQRHREHISDEAGEAFARRDGASSAIYKVELSNVHEELVAARDECERLTRQLRFARDSEAVASQCPSVAQRPCVGPSCVLTC